MDRASGGGMGASNLSAVQPHAYKHESPAASARRSRRATKPRRS